MAKWPWRSKPMTSIFNNSRENPKMHIWCKFGDSSSYPLHCDELSRGQAEFLKILCQNGQNYLDGQGQWPLFSIPGENIPGSMFGTNLVILAQICDELSRGQAGFPTILSQNGQNDLEGQDQWSPFSMPAESITGCMFGANLVILALICDELSRGQTEFPKIQSQNGQIELEGQGQWPLFSISVESIPRRMFGVSLVTPARTCYELSCGQGKVYGRQTDGGTDRRTDAGNDNTPSAWKAKG